MHDLTNPKNKGEGLFNEDLNSGCDCVAIKNLWFGNSINSISFVPSVLR